jgi:PPP family 3-phenylpropionic acid transporter
MKRTSSLTLPFGFGQASFWMSLCVTLSFAAVYLQALGFSNTELGLVMALGNVLGTLLGPLLASLSENHPRLSTAGLNRPLFLLRLLLLLGLLFCRGRSLWSAALYALYLADTMAVNSLNLKFCVDAELRALPLDYGVARAAGSLAYVLAAALLGLLVEKLGCRTLIWAGLAVLLLQAAANERTGAALGGAPLPERAGERREPGASLPAFLREEPRFALFLLGTVLLFFAHNTITNFLINIVENAGGSTETMGYLNAFMAVVEVPVMLLFSRFARGRRVSALLRLSVAMFLLKTLAFALAPSVPLLFAANLLQAPSFALYTCAVVPYVSAVIAPRNGAKAQSLAFSMTTLGAVGASLVSGWLLDRCSVRSTLLIAAAVCAAGVAVCLPAVKKTRRS